MKLLKAPLVSTILAAAGYHCVLAADCYLDATKLRFCCFTLPVLEPLRQIKD